MTIYANICDSLRKPLAALALLCVTLVSVSAHAGSIVINQADPNGSLQYKDDAGRTKDLLVSWSDLQLIAKVKGYLLSKHGEPGRSMPYMIDRSSQTVNVLVDRSASVYESVSFAQLKDF
jgi:hypothetical protein